MALRQRTASGLTQAQRPMSSRYDLLFEPVQIGPVVAPNRFYQVPHASGMTESNPRVRAKFRETKAEGGWGVVSTGAVSIHPSSDDSPLPFARLWDQNDVRAHAIANEAIHKHGALSAIELWHGGAAVMNRTSRIAPLSPSGIGWTATHVGFMGQLRPRKVSKDDIADILGWQRHAAGLAKQAGFDIVYVYAGMGYLGYEFLLDDYNKRTDEYGGSVENRTRFVREMLDATREVVGDSCAVALRISLEELRGKTSNNYESEAHEVVSLLSDVPDLWDVKMDSSPTDCGSSRFNTEGAHEPIINFVKSVTSKPVVGVGRFTSPDAMASQIKRGILDLIGGARPSIADPFLPNKIKEGRENDIRECIGCNICIASWHDGVPVRCTQNATAGEEWRKNWHPETYIATDRREHVLIVGAGPAGLEAALTAARRGYQVTLSEKASDIGGRINFEAELPGLNAWRRVKDYRQYQLNQLGNVEIYCGSELLATDILEFGADRIAIATGSTWQKTLYSALEIPQGELSASEVYTPTDIANGSYPSGRVLVYDHDNYYMGGVIAEHLSDRGCDVTYATPAGHASAWTIMTNEQPQVHQALFNRHIDIHTQALLTGFDGRQTLLQNIFTGAPTTLDIDGVVIVGQRIPETALIDELKKLAPDISAELIGDANAPGALVHAVYSGHQYARNLDVAEKTYLRDMPVTEFPPGFTI